MYRYIIRGYARKPMAIAIYVLWSLDALIFITMALITHFSNAVSIAIKFFPSFFLLPWIVFSSFLMVILSLLLFSISVRGSACQVFCRSKKGITVVYVLLCNNYRYNFPLN